MKMVKISGASHMSFLISDAQYHVGYSNVPSLTAFVLRCIVKGNLDIKRGRIKDYLHANTNGKK